MIKPSRIILALMLSVCALQNAAASTAQYGYSAFTTLEIRGNQLATPDQMFFGPNTLISGSFTYDNSAAGFPGASGTLYEAITNLEGSIGGNSYSDATGGILIINDGFDLNPTDPNDPLVDLIAIFAEGLGVPNLNGFSIDNNGSTFALVDVRLFWFTPEVGFIEDELLTSEFSPIAEIARIALDFQDVANAGITHTVFADPLVLSPAQVPLPAAVWMLLSAIGVLGAARKKG